MIPDSDYFACHPAWFGELSQIAKSIHLRKEVIMDFLNTYRGPAAEKAKIHAFNPNEVFQIADNEYYSFADGIRYRQSAEGKRIALIPLNGTLTPFHYTALAEMLQAATHPAYAGALIVADSPGGYTKKMDKLESAVSNYPKPIGVWVSGNLNSAAAYVTAGADWIAGDVDEEKNSFGSVGVFAIRENEYEKNEKEGVKVAIIRSEGAVDKAKPNPFEPWDDQSLAKIQDSVNKDGAKFLAVMQAKRKIMGPDMDEVKKGGEYNTDEAIKLGLADGRLSFGDAIEKVATNQLYV